MKKTFLALKKELDKINYSEIFKGFHRFPFALYTGETILLDNMGQNYEDFIKSDGIFQKSWDSRFMGNSSIEIYDKRLAIWDYRTCSEAMDMRQLTSKIVHEMFHCYQGEFSESRWANEAIGLQYNLDEEGLSYKLQEYKYLRRAAIFDDETALNKAISLRKTRKNISGKYLNYEAGIETTEGMAVFVEVCALQQLLGISREEVLKNYLPACYDDPEFVLKNRIPSYYSGLLIAVILDKSLENWVAIFMENKIYLYSIMDCIQHTSFPVEKVIITDKVKSAVMKRHKEINDTFDKFLESNIQIDKRECLLEGFDPMNAIYRNGMIYHRYFAKLGYNDRDVFIEGPLVTVFDEDIFKVKKVITLKN